MTTERMRPARLLLLLLTLVAAACGDDDGVDRKASEREGTLSSGKFTVCTDVPRAPFAFEENGRVVGIDAEIVRAIGGRLGLEPEFRDTDFDGIFAALEAGKCDVIASSVAITEERKKTVAFSDGYYEIVQSLLVRKGDAATYKDLASLRGRTIGVQSRTTGAAYAQQQSEANGYTVKEYGAADELFAALGAGQVDGVLHDFPVNAYHARTTGATEVSARFETQKEEYGIVVPKDEPELLKAINEALAQIRRDDTYNTIVRNYLDAAA